MATKSFGVPYDWSSVEIDNRRKYGTPVSELVIASRADEVHIDRGGTKYPEARLIRWEDAHLFPGYEFFDAKALRNVVAGRRRIKGANTWGVTAHRIHGFKGYNWTIDQTGEIAAIIALCSEVELDRVVWGNSPKGGAGTGLSLEGVANAVISDCGPIGESNLIQDLDINRCWNVQFRRCRGRVMQHGQGDFGTTHVQGDYTEVAIGNSVWLGGSVGTRMERCLTDLLHLNGGATEFVAESGKIGRVGIRSDSVGVGTATFRRMELGPVTFSGDQPGAELLTLDYSGISGDLDSVVAPVLISTIARDTRVVAQGGQIRGGKFSCVKIGDQAKTSNGFLDMTFEGTAFEMFGGAMAFEVWPGIQGVVRLNNCRVQGAKDMLGQKTHGITFVVDGREVVRG